MKDPNEKHPCMNVSVGLGRPLKGFVPLNLPKLSCTPTNVFCAVETCPKEIIQFTKFPQSAYLVK